MSKKSCASCRREIDAAARLCVFCGADPETGVKFDSSPVVESELPRRRDLRPHEQFFQFVRERQAIVVIAVIAFVFVAATTLHQVIRQRNSATVTDVPAIPLTEITDLSRQAGTEDDMPLPELEFGYEGSSRTMKTLLLEPGAVAPPPPEPPPNAQQPQSTGARPPQPAPRAAQPPQPGTRK